MMNMFRADLNNKNISQAISRVLYIFLYTPTRRLFGHNWAPWIAEIFKTCIV